jgi:uncharacterized membrane protein YfcA
MGGAYLGAYLSQFVSGKVQLGVLAALMLVAAILMVRPMKNRAAQEVRRRAALKLALEGVIVGAVTGFVGVGGGFLIIPALVLLGGLSMHRAVGTSLLIIAFNSFSGFYKALDVLDDLGLQLDWHVIWTFSVLGIAGSFAGSAVRTKLPQHILRKAFACFLFAVGAFIVFKSWPASGHSASAKLW